MHEMAWASPIMYNFGIKIKLHFLDVQKINLIQTILRQTFHVGTKGGQMIRLFTQSTEIDRLRRAIPEVFF